MEDNVNMLELLLYPAFCVREGRVAQCNREAARYLIAEGTPIGDMIATGAEEYADFHTGRLCLTLQIEGQRFAASVVAQEDCHIFILEQHAMDTQLQCMALVAQELRSPLAGMMTAADRLLPAILDQAAPAQDAAQMNRRLYQMLRLVSNMSDAARFAQREGGKEYVDIDAFSARSSKRLHRWRRRARKHCRTPASRSTSLHLPTLRFWSGPFTI